MSEELRKNGIYTTREVRDILKISESTIKRLLKKGIIKANKVGGQYRILGKEVLRLISPNFEKRVENVYMKIKKKAVKVVNRW